MEQQAGNTEMDCHFPLTCCGSPCCQQCYCKKCSVVSKSRL